MASSTTSKVVLRKRTQLSKRLSLKSSPRKPPKSGPKDGDYSDVCCEECGSGEREDELLLCDKCDRGFHLFCLRPVIASVPEGSWICPSCSSNIKNVASMFTASIISSVFDFFHVSQKMSLCSSPFTEQ